MGGQTTRRRFPARVGRIRSPDRNVTHELFNRRLPVTCYLPFLLRSYARTYVTLLRDLLLPCPPCISFSQSALSASSLSTISRREIIEMRISTAEAAAPTSVR